MSKEYWQARLNNASHYFDYSYGKQLVDVDDKRGERVYFDLSESISSELKAHCKSNRTTLFNVLVCAFSIFIHKYYRLNDILIGYPINIRPTGYKHFFGFFVNILPIRIDMNNDPTYQTLLKNIHQTRAEDKKHQKYPALDLVADIREKLPDFDGRVFNLSMAQTVSRLFNLELNEVDSEPLDSEYYDVNDDFSLSYEMFEQRIGLWFEYRQALFDRGFIKQAIQHIETIILQLLKFPDRKISQFKILSKQEESNILAISQQAIKQKEVDKNSVQNQPTIVSLFEAQLDESINHVAIVEDGTTYSYQLLNQRANQLARKIQSLIGVQSSAVAVSLERGFELIVTLLAILKSGCFYVPLPLNYPINRKNHILNEVDAKLWIVTAKHNATEKNEFNVNTETKSIQRLELNENELLSFSSKNLEEAVFDNEKAYVIYTSGSTGKPKGVQLTHKNVVSRLEWLKKYFSFDHCDRVLQNTDFSFDVSVAEIFWPLISGATLITSNQKKCMDQKYLLNLIQQEKITCCCMVPSLLRVLIVNDEKKQLNSIKHLLAAGEVLSDTLAKLFYSNDSTKNAVLYNFYGPTEAAIYASFEKIEPNSKRTITIGKALPNTSLYVLGDSKEILPLGVVGELYIGGDGVAKGYQANASLTAKSFIKDPFVNYDNSSPNMAGRLYATGDLVKFSTDGRLNYIGRIDRQVKIRGYRIELGEIETTITRNRDIYDVAVISRPKKTKQYQLIAYLVKNNESSLSGTELLEQVKKKLKASLPNYMMPSVFVFTKEIPRLASGKLNILLLPDPQENFIEHDEYKAADTKIEKILVEIWSELLSIKIDNISTSASFFDLGGDSLMAIQFVSLAEKRGLYFNMGDLFEMRNISQLAHVVKKNNSSINSQGLISGRYSLLPRQAKFFDDNFINPNYWNRTFSFHLNHHLNVDAFCAAVQQVLNHHDNLRVKFERDNNNDGNANWLQYCEEPENLTSIYRRVFSQIDLTDLSYSEQNLKIPKIINQRHQQINLSEAPLIRIIHFVTAKNRGQLAIIFHHLLLDMVSSRLIFEDLMVSYQSAIDGVTPQLDRKTTSIKQWVLYLQTRAREHDFSNALNYWGKLPKQTLPKLPNDFGLNEADLLLANCEENAQLKMFTLSPVYTKQLLINMPNKIGLPIQNFLMACLFENICDWTDSREMMISTCGHGREVNSEEFDLSRTVGWLNTVYPVYLTLPSEYSISDKTSIEYFALIKKQLASVPVDNMDYNLLRYSVKHPVMIKHASPELFFNYVGQVDAIIPKDVPFVPTFDLPRLAGIDGRNHLCYKLYFEAGVIGGQLTFRLTYSNKVFNIKTIEQLTQQFLKKIKNRVDAINLQ